MSPKNNNKQVSAAVRILQQKRDASARATHLMVKNDSLITYEKAISDQADKGKFPESTFLERKIMSTKTSFKRIALVAASALALGGFSVISAPQASAAHTASTLKVTGAFGTIAANELSGTQTTGGLMEVTLAETSTTGVLGTISSTGVGSITAYTAGATTSAPASTTYPTTSLTLTTSANHASAVNQVFTVSSSVAGTQTITFTPISSTGAPGTAKSVTITWGAAPAYTSATSYYFEGVGTQASSSQSQKAALHVNGTGSDLANFVVSYLNQSGTAFAPASLTAIVTGAGSFEVGTAAGGDQVQATARAWSTTSNAATSHVFTLQGDNTSGPGQLDVYTGTTLIASLKYVFYSPTIAKLVAEPAASVTNGTGDAISVKAYDAKDYLIRAAHGSLVGAAANVVTTISGWTCSAADDNAMSLDYAPGESHCVATVVAGKTGVVSAAIANGIASTSKVSNSVDVTVGSGTISSISMAFDKTEYVPGEKMLLTVTAKDLTGAAVADDGTYTDLLTFTGNLSSPSITADAVDGAFGILGGTTGAVAGTQVISIFAPATTGTFDLTATLGTAGITAALQGTKITAPPVEIQTADNGTASLALDAANAATDAANNAYDEAQNATQAASDALAAVTALAKQVKTLIASVKKLTAAVAKLR